MRNRIYQGDNLNALKNMPSNSVDLIYIDPPFNTGKTQKRDNGLQYDDSFLDLTAYLQPRFWHVLRVLKYSGSLFVHLDYREVHYVKVYLDSIFGRSCFMNEIIWSYDYGARSQKRWSTKHDTILWYVRDPNNYTFNYDAIDRIPYMAPGLVGPEKAAKGKTPTDVWWNTIVPTNGSEKTGYPTQKPLAILNRIVQVHSNPGDHCLDFFAGSGSFGEAAIRNNRFFTLVDRNPQAIEVMKKRLDFAHPLIEVLRDQS